MPRTLGSTLAIVIILMTGCGGGDASEPVVVDASPVHDDGVETSIGDTAPEEGLDTTTSADSLPDDTGADVGADDSSSTVDASPDATSLDAPDSSADIGADAPSDTKSDACTPCGTTCCSTATAVCMFGTMCIECSTLGQVKCGGACVDLSSSPESCGACGKTCSVVCVSGACATSCPGTKTACSGYCRDTAIDVSNCGGCGKVCPIVAGASGTCTGGVCGFACYTDRADCNKLASDGCETSLLDSHDHCGACGKACGTTEICAAGACVVPRRVFITSTTHTGNLGGAAGADVICQTRATAASLGGTWRAWVSGGGTVAGRFIHHTVPYVRLDGKRIASNWTDLTDGTIGAAITIDEFGASVGTVQTWTGTLADGTQPSTGANDCLDWSTGSKSTFGHIGSTARLDSWWSWTEFPSVADCNVDLRLYCFEQ